MNRIVSKKLLKGYLNLESGQMNEINIKRSGGQVSTESLWAFPLDNWNQRTEIFTKGIMLSTKEEKVMPLVEGKMQAGGKEYPQVGARWRGSKNREIDQSPRLLVCGNQNPGKQAHRQTFAGILIPPDC